MCNKLCNRLKINNDSIQTAFTCICTIKPSIQHKVNISRDFNSSNIIATLTTICYFTSRKLPHEVKSYCNEEDREKYGIFRGLLTFSWTPLKEIRNGILNCQKFPWFMLLWFRICYAIFILSFICFFNS